MKLRKSILALLLAFAMVFALTACGGQDAEEPAEDAGEDAAATETTEEGLVEADKGDLEEFAVKVITAAIEGDADAYISYLDPEYLAYLESKGVDEAALKEKLISASEAYKKDIADECGDDFTVEHSVFKSPAIDVMKSDPDALKEEIDVGPDIDVGLEFDLPENADYTTDYSNAEAVARVGINSECKGSKGDKTIESKWFFVQRDGKWYMAMAREVDTMGSGD